MPKYNRLNSLPLLSSLKKSRRLYKKICEEIGDFLEALEVKEQKVLALSRNHHAKMLSRQQLDERIKKKLHEKLNHDKAFKNIERETKKIIKTMDGVGKKEQERQDAIEEER